MAEFKSLVNDMNKQKEFKPLKLEKEDNLISTNDMIPGVDKPRLQGEISVDGDSAVTQNLQSQIDSLDNRVDALENP